MFTSSFYKSLTITTTVVLLTMSCLSNQVVAMEPLDGTADFSNKTQRVPGELVEIERGLLYVGQAKTPKGTPIYYGYEKVTETNFDFWAYYAQQASKISRACKFLYLGAVEPPNSANREAMQTIFGFSSEEHDELIRNTSPNKFKVFESISAGILGMDVSLSCSNESRSKYVFYASKTPITKRFENFKEGIFNKSIVENCASEMEEFRIHYSSILMSCVATTAENIPTVTHFGIFRNPLSFMDETREFSDLAMPLHGFGAAVQLSFFKGKYYMISQPTQNMTDRMLLALEPESVHLGTIADLVNNQKTLVQYTQENKLFEYAQNNAEFLENNPTLPYHNEEDMKYLQKRAELFQKYPPLLHYDENTKLYKIAKKGVNLQEYINALPDNLASFCQSQGQQFDFSGFTLGALSTLIDLPALAKSYTQQK